ncbi:MAG: helix-turn-helix domain-containing protein [Alphaproteobacteria bacterium]|nr:helix-turn-helix domain-containing protein [Alphaproteobacteria bacterium]
MTVCAPLDDEEQRRLRAISTTLKLEPRRMVFEEGAPAEYVYNITSGAVSLSKSLADGRRQITGFLYPGDFLGLTHNVAYAYTAETLTHVCICRFPRKKFEEMLLALPQMEHRLLTIASNELATAQDQMLLLGRKTASERLASFLVGLIDRQAARGGAIDVIDLPMGRGEIADYLGLTIETVSRTFTKLKQAGAIALPDANSVRIIGAGRLRDLASGN